MRGMFAILRRFHSDDRGVFAVIFGILAVVLVAAAGAVIDYSSVEQARTRAQIALDAAALGLQPTIFNTPQPTEDQLKSSAFNLVTERLDDARLTITIDSAVVVRRDGMLRLSGSVTSPTAFMGLIGFPSLRVQMMAEATRKQINLEVAMVLDNSGSMASSSRMTRLKEAANSATDIIFDNQDSLPNVKIAIVPFTQFVNVGTSNRTASWMSQTGASSFSHLNFDNDDDEDTPFTTTVNRWSLWDNTNGMAWRGCVEARATPYDSDDTAPTPLNQDTYFQPVFAPDTAADGYISDNPTPACDYKRHCTWTVTSPNCNSSGGSCGTSTTSYTAVLFDGSVKTGSSVCSCTGETILTDDTTLVKSGSKYTKTRTRTCQDSYSRASSELSALELAQRLCKYKGASWTGDGANSDCPTTPLLPLNNVRATVKARINDMVAAGSTNIAQGTIWGLHSLSSTEPLTEGSPYEQSTSKVLIVMTDGENNPNYQVYSPASGGNYYGNSSWTAWGYRINKRLLTESTIPQDSTATSAQVVSEVDRRVLASCTAAKAENIKVYTIGLAAPNNLKQMLRDCATPTENAGTPDQVVYSYFPNTSAELVTVFEEIASQLSNLRLAR